MTENVLGQSIDLQVPVNGKSAESHVRELQNS